MESANPLSFRGDGLNSTFDFSSISSRKLLSNATLSAGSTVCGDSFAYFTMSDEDDGDRSVDSYDPYLETARRRRRLRPSPEPKYFVERQNTPSTVPDSSSDESLGREPVQPPTTLEIPIRLFTTAEKPKSRSGREQESPELRKAQHERNYWNRLTSDRISLYGSAHCRTAEGLLNLASAHMRCKEYVEAASVSQSALHIYHHLYGKKHVAVAKALDKMGLALCRQSRSQEILNAAAGALDQSFLIRYELLGATHVDTVDTLNHLAGVYQRMGKLRKAKQAYYEVLTMRKLIFGKHHPSVAITSHALGNLYVKLSKPDRASTYYSDALDIYKRLRLTLENPSVRKLMKDIRILNRIAKLKSRADI